MNKLILIVAVVLFLVGGYFVQNQQVLTTENQIIIKNFAFNPAALTIKRGITAIWTNEDPAPHQIKSDTFNSEIINKGESFQFRFDDPGTYDYVCGIHPAMKGEIIVQE